MRLNEGPPPSLPYPSRLFHPPRHFSARESRGETFYDYLRLLDHPHAANNRTSRVSRILYRDSCFYWILGKFHATKNNNKIRIDIAKSNSEHLMFDDTKVNFGSKLCFFAVDSV